MTPQPSYQILDGLPTYGPMYISIPANNYSSYSEGYVVKFFRTDGTEWVGNFEKSYTDLKGVYTLPETANLLVIAGGICYMMNPDSTVPLSDFGYNYVVAIEIENSRLLLHDENKLTIVETDGRYWDSDRISFDGIKDVKITGNIVTGLAYNPMEDADEWVQFSYDIERRILTGGSFYEFSEPKKPWWKFW